jgi:hypothetical protein
MPFQKGQSGNPNGRPPKTRALTDLLEKAGRKTVIVDGRKVARNRFLADAIWQAITERKVTLPGGSELLVGPDDWWDAVQFLYKHVDGPPKAELDVTSNGNVIKVSIGDESDDGSPD